MDFYSNIMSSLIDDICHLCRKAETQEPKSLPTPDDSQTLDKVANYWIFNRLLKSDVWNLSVMSYLSNNHLFLPLCTISADDTVIHYDSQASSLSVLFLLHFTSNPSEGLLAQSSKYLCPESSHFSPLPQHPE